MNISHKITNLNKFLDEISNIHTEEDYKNLFKNMNNIPYVKYKNDFYNFTFFSIISNNSFLLDKLLNKFPNSFHKEIYIQEENLKQNLFLDYINEKMFLNVKNIYNLNNTFEHQKINKNIEKKFFNNLSSDKILKVLQEHNLINEIFFELLKNKRRFEDIISITKFFYKNEFKITKEMYNYYFYAKNIYHKFNLKNYEAEKNLYSNYLNKDKNNFINDSDIFNIILENPININLFFKDVIRNLKINGIEYSEDTFLEWKEVKMFSIDIIKEILDKNNSLELIEILHKHLPDNKLPIKNDNLIHFYNSAFQGSIKNFVSFYKKLKDNYNFHLSPEYVNSQNKDNVSFIINNYNKEVGNECRFMILNECKNGNYKFYNFLMNFSNINKQIIFDLFIKSAISINRKRDYQNISDLIQLTHLNNEKWNINLNIKSNSSNDTKIFIEKEIISVHINTNNILKNKIKRL